MNLVQIAENIIGMLGGTALDFDAYMAKAVPDCGGWEGLEAAVSRAHREQDTRDLYAAHLLLNQIYRVLTSVPAAGTVTVEGAYSLARVRHLLEQAFIGSLDRDVAALIPADIPAERYADWLRDFIAVHPAANHQAYTGYLAEKASLADIRFYLVQESAIDANTDDFLASLQVGAPHAAKLEIAANFWDEMGEGDHNLLHSDLFKNALRSFDISDDETNDALTLDALVCGNLQTMLSLRRELFHRGVGYFAATEQLVPDRFKALKKGWDRVGLPQKGAEYHLLHIEVDAHHTQRWYRDVIAPLAQESAAARRHMLVGALYRLLTSERYLNGLETLFQTKKASATI